MYVKIFVLLRFAQAFFENVFDESDGEWHISIVHIIFGKIFTELHQV